MCTYSVGRLCQAEVYLWHHRIALYVGTRLDDIHKRSNSLRARALLVVAAFWWIEIWIYALDFGAIIGLCVMSITARQLCRITEWRRYMQTVHGWIKVAICDGFDVVDSRHSVTLKTYFHDDLFNMKQENYLRRANVSTVFFNMNKYSFFFLLLFFNENWIIVEWK